MNGTSGSDCRSPEKPLWVPSSDRVAAAEITTFADWVARRLGQDPFGTYSSLWNWSVGAVEEFWQCIWEYFDVQSDGRSTTIIGRQEMPGTEWFPGARLNYAEHVFRGREPAALAVIGLSETEDSQGWTWGDLETETARIALGLRRLGVGPGDRVAGFLPNSPETVAAFLATASAGAVWSCVPPEFGASAAVDRLGQVEPKVLLAANGYHHGGKRYDRRNVVHSIRAQIPSLEHLVVLDRGFGAVPGAVQWGSAFAEEAALEYERVDFDHPLWILYSSGTTGLPKAIVHGHGGILLEQLKMGRLHVDAREGDRVFWFTTTGWMMWNFLVGLLLTGASIVVYDGSATSPSADVLWDIVDRHAVTIFGTSPAYIARCMADGIRPRSRTRRLVALRAVGSTGSPLPSEAFDWIYEAVDPDVWLFSTSGGTDVCTAFVGGVPTLPVFRGELQARALGAAVEAWGADASALVGEIGELVLTRPLPSMPTHLWGDADGTMLRETYFAAFPGVWRHGDWIEINERGGAVIHGRSDATINRGGIRMGTSEIYRCVLQEREIIDALVVDVPRVAAQSWMPLFVVLREGASLDEDLRSRISARIRTECSPRHVPDTIIEVADVPRTVNGKLVEVPVKRILSGEPPSAVVSRDSLANPATLDIFVRLARDAGAMEPNAERTA